MTGYAGNETQSISETSDISCNMHIIFTYKSRGVAAGFGRHGMPQSNFGLTAAFPS